MMDKIRYLHVNDPSAHSIHCLLKLEVSTNYSTDLLSNNIYKDMNKIISYKWDDIAKFRFQKAVKKTS